jgi:hypothetical protein
MFIFLIVITMNIRLICMQFPNLILFFVGMKDQNSWAQQSTHESTIVRQLWILMIYAAKGAHGLSTIYKLGDLIWRYRIGLGWIGLYSFCLLVSHLLLCCGFNNSKYYVHIRMSLLRPVIKAKPDDELYVCQDRVSQMQRL